MGDKAEKLAKLQKDLAELKKNMPEHCAGAEGYISAHRTSIELWTKIDDLETEIAELKKELGAK
jgi:hypothetical protein